MDKVDYSVITNREGEILMLIAEGKKSSYIAKKLGISIRTVETHRRNISLKLGLECASQLVLCAHRYMIALHKEKH